MRVETRLPFPALGSQCVGIGGGSEVAQLQVIVKLETLRPARTHTEDAQNIKALASHDTMLASVASPHYLEIKPSAAERGMAGRSMVSEHDD